jgi:hypothetical protein
MELWIARDLDGTLFLTDEEPILGVSRTNWLTSGNLSYIELSKDMFPEVTFKNSPQRVELKLLEETVGIKESLSKTFPRVSDFDLEKWVEIIKKHYTTMRGFHPETYKITLDDIEAVARFFYDLGFKKAIEEPDCICDNHTPSKSQITVGTKIRLKTNTDVILSIISNDCHGDEYECSNGSVLSLKQIEKYYDIVI